MDRKFKMLIGVLGTVLCFVCFSNEAQGQTLPDGKGKAEFMHNCTACHHASMVIRVKKTPEEWRKSVDEMAARGTDGSKQDLDNAYLYLVANYSADKPNSTAATPSPASTSPAAPNSSEPQHPKDIVAGNGCLICHRIEQQGAYTAPTLNGIGTQRTAAEIRTAIVSPPPALQPGNYLANLTTVDGKTLIGRILSQDDRQLRVVNASGEAVTYLKSDLSRFAVINTNPMPSYEKRIAGEDLDGLVRYLVSLPPVDESLHK